MTERCLDLERTIRRVAKDHSIFDPELRNIRADLQDACRAALTTDFKNAQKANLESVLWKQVFYKPIEEFRNRLAKPESQTIKEKTRSAFLKFLQQGISFYTDLVDVLKARAQHSIGNEGVLPLVTDVRHSVSRCLICIGDLERYASISTSPGGNSSNSATQHVDLEAARKAYAAAAAICPESGNAYNQLAVLSSLDGSTLASAYYYLRAYFAPRPFTVARANLALLFDQARSAALKLRGGPTPRRGSAVKGSRPQAALEKDLAVFHVAVLGPLFLHIDIDATPRNLEAASKDLDEYLNRLRQQATGGGSGGSRRGSVTGNALKRGGALAGAYISVDAPALESLLASPPHHLIMVTASLLLLAHSSSGNDLSSTATRAYTCSALFDIGAKIAGIAAKVQLCDPKTHRLRAHAAASPLYPPLRILLKWMMLNTDIALPALPPPSSSSPLPHGNASTPQNNAHGTVDDVPILSSLLLDTRVAVWRAIGELAASVCSVATSGAFDGCSGAPAGTSVVSSTSLSKRRLLEDVQLQAFAPFTLLDAATGGFQSNSVREEYENQEVDPRGVPPEELPPAGSADASSVYRLKCIWEDMRSLAAFAVSWRASDVDGVQDAALRNAVESFINATGVREREGQGQGTRGGGAVSLIIPDEGQVIVQQEEEEEEEMILFAPQQGRTTPHTRSRSGTPALPQPAAAAPDNNTNTNTNAPLPPLPPEPPTIDDEEMEDVDVAAARMVHEMAARVLSPEPDAQGRLPSFTLPSHSEFAARLPGSVSKVGSVPAPAPAPGISPPVGGGGGGLFGEQMASPLLPLQNQDPSSLFPPSSFLGYVPEQEHTQMYAPLSGEQRPAEGLRSLLFGQGHFGLGPAAGSGWEHSNGQGP